MLMLMDVYISKDRDNLRGQIDIATRATMSESDSRSICRSGNSGSASGWLCLY